METRNFGIECAHRRNHATLPITKLTLLVLVLPCIVLASLDIINFNYNGTIDASTTISAILVLLLVWERFRDTLNRKLEYLYKNCLFQLHKALKTEIFYLDQNEVKRIRNDLGKYGRFMGISLYPGGLLKNGDELLRSHEDFRKKLDEIEEVGKTHWGMDFDSDLWLHLLGIKPLSEAELQGYESQQTKFKSYIDRLIKVRDLKSDLIGETKKLKDEVENANKEILGKLEGFFKSSNLEYVFEDRPRV